MIEKETIERIKTSVDIKDLVESKGIRLKKNGKGWFGLCPFHNDKNPSLSVTPSKNEWHCFGCGAGEDVIRFVEMFDQVDFKEAVSRLGGNPAKSAKKKAAPEKKLILTAKLINLFNRVIEFYHTAFAENPEPKEYLNKRGITDNAVFSDYKTGHADGSLLTVLPDDPDIKKQFKEIGIFNAKSNRANRGQTRLNRGQTTVLVQPLV